MIYQIAVIFILQILQEEEHMHNMFGEEYNDYKKHARRCWGKR